MTKSCQRVETGAGPYGQGIQVTSILGVTAEVYPISSCTVDGWAPHRIGDEGSLSCEPCRLREIARLAPREAS